MELVHVTYIRMYVCMYLVYIVALHTTGVQFQCAVCRSLKKVPYRKCMDTNEEVYFGYILYLFPIITYTFNVLLFILPGYESVPTFKI